MFSIGYPLSWVVLISLISIGMLAKKLTVTSASMCFVSILLGVSITPAGSNAWLASISFVFDFDADICDQNALPRNAIFLPGGLTSIGHEVSMTNWTENRIHALVGYKNKQNLREIIIPGGDIYRDRREGEYIVQQLNTMNFSKANIRLGEGSYSTNSNFLEIKPLINKNETYALFTSEWHAYRALGVARKQGIRSCFYDSGNGSHKRTLKEYPWNFKAAVREYLAIIWYGLKGRI